MVLSIKITLNIKYKLYKFEFNVQYYYKYIGDLRYQENGRVTSQRVLDVNGPVVENSYSAIGILRDNIPVTNIATIKVF
jgi:hypothetical protein